MSGLIERADKIRAEVLVSDVVGRVVELKKRGADFFGVCPFHNERSGSFSVNDKKKFYHCFGCGEHGDVIQFLRRREDLDFRSAIELLESKHGLRHLAADRPRPAPPTVPQRGDVSKADNVAKIWNETRELVAGDMVDRYLRGRLLVPPGDCGLADAVNAGWPIDLRFAPSLWHSLEKRALPGMVAAFRTAPGAPVVGVHRTYLKAAGTGAVKAGTGSDKMMLGDVRGAAIWLAALADRMGGGEGIETSLSGMQIFKRAGLAFGARGGMAKLELPASCSDFVYWADKNKRNADPRNTRVGEAAAAEGKKLNATGRVISIQVPTLPAETADFNDVLKAIAERRSVPE